MNRENSTCRNCGCLFSEHNGTLCPTGGRISDPLDKAMNELKEKLDKTTRLGEHSGV